MGEKAYCPKNDVKGGLYCFKIQLPKNEIIRAPVQLSPGQNRSGTVYLCLSKTAIKIS